MTRILRSLKDRLRKLVETRPTLSRPQWEVYRAGWISEARFRSLVAGRRFGKTTLAVEEIRRAARLAAKLGVHPDNEIWYAAPNFKQAKRVF